MQLLSILTAYHVAIELDFKNYLKQISILFALKIRPEKVNTIIVPMSYIQIISFFFLYIC